MFGKSLLEMKYSEAKKFFLESESYCNLELPDYFDFGSYLKKLKIKIGKKKLSDISKDDLFPGNYEGVNYTFFNNKDGKYEWRPFQFIHPALYIAFINEITEEPTWKEICNRFKTFANNTKIKCLSIPVEAVRKEKDKAAQILSWWEGIEQESLRLSLKYSYMVQTDITNCYPSIYTHAISWAMHDKETMKKTENMNNQTFVGNRIDTCLRAMQYNQTNGIPQGSVLMDFIAEILLGYIDVKLSEEIKKHAIEDYQILRYRDDYRIFVNNPIDGENILKALNHILASLGLKLNSKKTIFSDNLILSSVKEEKVAWLAHAKEFDNRLQAELFHIYQFSIKYPNSGQLIRGLDSVYRNIDTIKDIKDIDVLLAIVTDIVFRNPKLYPISIAIISKLIDKLDIDKRREPTTYIIEKLKNVSNNAYLEIWLQRVALKVDESFSFDDKICQFIAHQTKDSLWCSDWLKEDYKLNMNLHSFINDNKKDTIPLIINPSEFRVFYRIHSL